MNSCAPKWCAQNGVHKNGVHTILGETETPKRLTMERLPTSRAHFKAPARLTIGVSSAYVTNYCSAYSPVDVKHTSEKSVVRNQTEWACVPDMGTMNTIEPRRDK